MMPKGVEHRSIVLWLLRFLEVRIPMMPKGVEHKEIGLTKGYAAL